MAPLPDREIIRRIALECRRHPEKRERLTSAERKMLWDYRFLWQTRATQRYSDMFASIDEIVNNSGRGSGKSYGSSVWLVEHALYEAPSGSCGLLMGPTHKYFEDMVKGDNSLEKIAPPGEQVIVRMGKGPGWYFPRRNYWVLYASAEVPDSARGPSYTTCVFEEMCMNPPAKLDYIYNATILAIRKGKPKTLISSTPKPSKWISDKVKDPRVLAISESTFANAANLPAEYLEKMKRIFGNTLFGQQEMHGRILESTGLVMFDSAFKRREQVDWRKCRYMAISIDPANAESAKNDETGLIVYGVIDTPDGQNLVVFEDLSGHHNPSQIVKLVNDARCRYGAKLLPDERTPRGGAIAYVVAETNSGGHWIRTVLEAGTRLPILDNHSVESKACRVENCNPAWQSGQIVLSGEFPLLEEQLESFAAGTVHDDRVDALTQAVYDAFDLWAGTNHARSATVGA